MRLQIGGLCRTLAAKIGYFTGIFSFQDEQVLWDDCGDGSDFKITNSTHCQDNIAYILNAFVRSLVTKGSLSSERSIQSGTQSHNFELSRQSH
jgi:hypothetical protein